MLKKVKAIYCDGTFIPQDPCYLPENAEVELTIQVASGYAHTVVDRETRKEILEALLHRMRQTSMMANAHRVTISE
ncbi:antitoxin family protein [Crocosphaera sp. UHCC 0190]|uniref:antitoxin family protein n=1 Tax=Crocosphaera sp. UHCC 0190 TaxID=3110246 RepID=UPI002B217552|nr:antitoxin family protein [Crocosphaera sp. UHCC 0190]MEA5511047.1 antitoxin family protein [Crocosphaera sp. UHCC 0190]